MVGSAAPGPPDPESGSRAERVPPDTTGQPLAPRQVSPRASGQWLAVVAIALGFVALFGGVGTIAVLAIRTKPERQTPAPSIASAPRLATPLPSALTEPAPQKSLEPPVVDGLDPSERERPPTGGPLSDRPRSKPVTAGPAAPSEARAFIPVSLRQPIAGTSAADVTLSFFGDLGSPHTQNALRTLSRLRERHAETLRIVFYHRPIEAGSGAASLSRAVALTTLREGPVAGWEALERAARPGAGADVASVTPRERERIDELLLEDQRLAAVLDVRLTPTLFVNGTRLMGEPDESALESAIQRERRAVVWLRAERVAPERAYALRVRKNLIGVEDGAPDRACVPQGDAPALGPADALVTLVEFSGFECNACRELERAIADVVRRHPKEIRRVFRGLSPDKPTRARRIAAFALSAQRALGDPAFWSLYRALREAPNGLDDAGLLSVAKRVGLDGERLLALASDESNARRLNQDLALANALNLPAVPAIFLNGRLLASDLSAANLEVVVRQELAIARRIARAGTPPSRFDQLLCWSQ